MNNPASGTYGISHCHASTSRRKKCNAGQTKIMHTRHGTRHRATCREHNGEPFGFQRMPTSPPVARHSRPPQSDQTCAPHSGQDLVTGLDGIQMRASPWRAETCESSKISAPSAPRPDTCQSTAPPFPAGQSGAEAPEASLRDSRLNWRHPEKSALSESLSFVPFFRLGPDLASICHC
jgi:hypothetical protein